MRQWWDEVRTPIAFLVAPLATPLLWAGYFALQEVMHGPPAYASPQGLNTFLLFAGLFSYAGTFVLGIPTYLFLRANGATAFWYAPVVGSIAGALVISIVLGRASSDLQILCGLSGAAVGTVLWVIARPDRQPMASGGGLR